MDDDDDGGGEDIPAWFMTYSDVITLLMTFFILLLTFATTEPEQFEKVQPSLFGSSGATGIAGHKHEKLDKDAWSQRIRPPASRMALDGSVMPPILKDRPTEAVGRGLESVNEEEAAVDVMRRHAFQVKIDTLVNRNNKLTRRGEVMAKRLAGQLQNFPVNLALETANESSADRATAFAHHLFHVNGVRPALVSVGDVGDLQSDLIRFVVERYEP